MTVYEMMWSVFTRLIDVFTVIIHLNECKDHQQYFEYKIYIRLWFSSSILTKSVVAKGCNLKIKQWLKITQRYFLQYMELSSWKILQ